MSNGSKPSWESPIPQWTPPRRLRDPYVRRINCARARWVRAIRGRIPKIHDAAVAAYLATYGNTKGAENSPGIARLASDLFLSESTVKRSMAWLTEHGWITCSRRGDRWAKRSDEYQLTLPAPLAVEMGIWPADDPAQWIERPARAPKRAGVRDRGAPMRQGRQGASDATEIGVRKEEIGVCNDSQVSVSESQVSVRPRDRGPSPGTPPEHSPEPSLHQNFDHHSDLPDRPHAAARGGQRWPKLDPDDPDVFDQIIDCVCERYGPVGLYAQNMADSLLAEGKPIPLILNAVAAAVRDGTDSPE